MILKKQNIPDATALRLISKLLKKNQTSKKFKVKTRQGESIVTYDEIVQFVDILAKMLDEGRYGVIRRCDTCGNFNPSGKSNKRGWCSPKDRSLFRNKTDHCSKWIPMTEEQKHIREVLNEHFGTLQTK